MHCCISPTTSRTLAAYDCSLIAADDLCLLSSCLLSLVSLAPRDLLSTMLGATFGPRDLSRTTQAHALGLRDLSRTTPAHALGPRDLSRTTAAHALGPRDPSRTTHPTGAAQGHDDAAPTIFHLHSTDDLQPPPHRLSTTASATSLSRRSSSATSPSFNSPLLQHGLYRPRQPADCRLIYLCCSPYGPVSHCRPLTPS